MDQNDIRWIQRFSSYKKALDKLEQGVLLFREKYIKNGVVDRAVLQAGEDIMIEGIIQRFEYTHELAWNVMKDYAIYQGNPEVGGSRDSVREAMKLHLIEDGQEWMNMIVSRTNSSHTYNEEVAFEVLMEIIDKYYPLFVEFKHTMEQKR